MRWKKFYNGNFEGRAQTDELGVIGHTLSSRAFIFIEWLHDFAVLIATITDPRTV